MERSYGPTELETGNSVGFKRIPLLNLILWNLCVTAVGNLPAKPDAWTGEALPDAAHQWLAAVSFKAKA
jgi:hypothetical protein